jgi:hypothetical protein
MSLLIRNFRQAHSFNHRVGNLISRLELLTRATNIWIVNGMVRVDVVSRFQMVHHVIVGDISVEIIFTSVYALWRFSVFGDFKVFEARTRLNEPPNVIS